MRIINQAGRLGLLTAGGYLDVETASDGTFGSDPQAIYERWDSFRSWARVRTPPAGAEIRPVIDERLQAPVPRPRQVFAIGVNYRDHAAKAGIDLPAEPMVFTKFPSAITGPYGTIALPPRLGRLRSRTRRGHRPACLPGARSGVPGPTSPGLTIGQDLSEREPSSGRPRRSSTTSASPTPASLRSGPCLVTPDEFD